MSMTGQHPGSTLPATGEAPPLVVVVVGDSRARTRALRNFLSAPGFVVAAEVCTAREAEAAVVEHRPGAVLLDLDPASGGIEAIERIMGTRPTPVVVCGALAAHSQAALAAGAVDVVGALDALPTSPQYVTALRRHLRVASRVRVITHPRNRLREKGLDGSVADAPVRRPPTPHGAVPGSNIRVVVIGASTGGPPALATILADLPADLPVPVVVIQHMADGFVEGLASWLDGLSPLPCCGPGCGSSCAPRRRASSTCRVSTPPSSVRPRSAARTPSACCSPAWAATALPGCGRCATRAA